MADEARAQLAHLFRRAGFGARPDEIDYYALRGYAAAVDDLVSGRPLAGSLPVSVSTGESPPPGATYERAELRRAQARWIRSMVTTATPLVERMTLFLTDHFATSFSPGDHIGVIDIENHVNLIRGHALGSFADLTRALIEDVAFAIWLDAHRNRRGIANENLARELFELHTLGAGNYTETDVREAARSLTGYKLVKQDGSMMSSGSPNQLIFDSRLHDYGEKTVLGRTGTFMPRDVVDIALAQPAAPTFVATALVAAFQSPAPNADLVARVAAALRTNNWQLAPALRTLFMAPEFIAGTSRGAVVKSPAEFVAGALRSLKRAEYEPAASLAAACGQSLFEPPNVAGWRPNEGWLGAGMMLGRYNAAATIGQWHATQPATGFAAPATLDGWMKQFGMVELAPATTAAINTYMRETLTLSDKVRQAGLVTLLLSSPDFSLA